MTDDPFRLDKKRIIITGSSSGIGRQSAIICSRLGAKVFLFGRDKLRLEETLSLMTHKERHAIVMVNLLDYELIGSMITSLVTHNGKFDGLVNCAGISTTLPLNATQPDKVNLLFQTNVIGALNLTKQIVKQQNFSETGGSIIFISSVMGVVGENGKTIYSMSKGALIAGVKSLAIELSARSIRVNSISPGVVDTPMSQKAFYNRDPASREKIEKLHPLGIGRPEDVAFACAFLLSDASRWITGTNMIVDGGYLAK